LSAPPTPYSSLLGSKVPPHFIRAEKDTESAATDRDGFFEGKTM